MLDQLLGSLKGNVVSDLTSKLGLSGDQASGFLQQALSMLQSAFSSGKIDPSALLSGNLSGIISKLDLGALSGLVGGDTAKAKTGLESVLGGLTSSLKSNPDAAALLGQLGGGGATSGSGSGDLLGQVTTMAGKFFSKK